MSKFSGRVVIVGCSKITEKSDFERRNPTNSIGVGVRQRLMRWYWHSDTFDDTFELGASAGDPMRTFLLYLIAAASVTTCGLSWSNDAQAQLSQALKDYVHDRPLLYAPSDPWTRSRLFIKHTKHYGFGYNCDGEECKRNSPYIKWQVHHENDVPPYKSCRQRLDQTLAEVKQRIADGSCETGHACESCGVSDRSITTGVCTSCQSPAHGGLSVATPAPQPPLPVVVSEKTPTNPPVTEVEAPVSTRRVQTAGLESLDNRIKDR